MRMSAPALVVFTLVLSSTALGGEDPPGMVSYTMKYVPGGIGFWPGFSR
jgi:hypothetical protein